MLKGPFKILFDLQGGVGEAPQFSVFEGEIPLPKLDPPEREHYDFLGWSLTTENPTFIEKYFDIDAETSVYAIWERTDFLIKYNANGGIGEMEDSYVSAKTKQFTFPENKFAKIHFAFDGWKTSATGDVIFQPGDKIFIEDDIEVFAQWKRSEILLKFNGNGSPEEVDPIYVPFTFNLPANPFYYRRNEFTGWKTSISGDKIYAAGSSITITQDIEELTITAQWKKVMLLRQATSLAECAPGKVFYIMEPNFDGNKRTLKASAMTFDYDKGYYKCYTAGISYNEIINQGGNYQKVKLYISDDTPDRFSSIRLSNGKYQIVDLDSDTPSSQSGWVRTSGTNDRRGITREGGKSGIGQGLGTSLVAEGGKVWVADMMYYTRNAYYCDWYAGRRQFCAYVEREEEY